MKITRDDLRRAVDDGVLQTGQDEALWQALAQQHRHQPRFDLAHVSYYAGALIVIEDGNAAGASKATRETATGCMGAVS